MESVREEHGLTNWCFSTWWCRFTSVTTNRCCWQRLSRWTLHNWCGLVNVLEFLLFFSSGNVGLDKKRCAFGSGNLRWEERKKTTTMESMELNVSWNGTEVQNGRKRWSRIWLVSTHTMNGLPRRVRWIVQTVMGAQSQSIAPSTNQHKCAQNTHERLSCHHPTTSHHITEL